MKRLAIRASENEIPTGSAGLDNLLRKVRRQLGRIERASRELKRIQRSIPMPSAEEFIAIMEGSQPFSELAYLLAVLQYAALSHEEGTLNVRADIRKVNFLNPDLRMRVRRSDLDLGALIEAVRQERARDDVGRREDESLCRSVQGQAARPSVPPSGMP
jgi:hypothetical protein